MNQKTLLIAIATLIVAIFAFAQVYIIFTVTTINDRINSVEIVFMLVTGLVLSALGWGLILVCRSLILVCRSLYDNDDSGGER